MEKSGFFGSNSGDRKYPTKNIAGFLSQIFTNGIFNNSCQVIANDDMSITIKEGWAFINGYWYHNDSDKILNIEITDSNQSRIDNIVLRYIVENRDIVAQVIEGNYATNPVAPDLQRNTACYDLRIAKISIPTGSDKITQSMIEDCRFDSMDCGNVTQAVLQLNTTDIFKQYQIAFEEWFEKLKINLDENVATNLQNEINNINNRMLEIDEVPVEDIEEYADCVLKDSIGNILNPTIPRYEEIVKVQEFAQTVSINGNGNTWITMGKIVVPVGYTFIGVIPIANGIADQWQVTYAKYGDNVVAYIKSYYNDQISSSLKCTALFLKI